MSRSARRRPCFAHATTQSGRCHDRENQNPGLLAEGFLQKTSLLCHVEIDPNDGRVLHTQPSSPDDVTTGEIKNSGQLAESRDHVACIMSHLEQQPRCEFD